MSIEMTSSGFLRRIFPTPSHVRRISCFDKTGICSGKMLSFATIHSETPSKSLNKFKAPSRLQKFNHFHSFAQTPVKRRYSPELDFLHVNVIQPRLAHDFQHQTENVQHLSGSDDWTIYLICWRKPLVLFETNQTNTSELTHEIRDILVGFLLSTLLLPLPRFGEAKTQRGQAQGLANGSQDFNAAGIS